MESTIPLKKNAIEIKSEEAIVSGIKPIRIHAMDSLRGLASLQVLIHHALGMTILFYGLSGGQYNPQLSPLLKLLTFSPLHIFWAGHEAVIFFFVMSGFVLAIPYYKGKGGKYSSFFVKRMFRIYAPYLITILIGLFLNQLYFGHAALTTFSPWVNEIFTLRVNTETVINFVFFLKGAFPKIVTSLWSLPVEIKISFLLPFIFIPIKRLNKTVTFILPFANIVFYYIGKRMGLQDLFGDFALFYYFSFFLFGAVLSKYQNEILPFFNGLSKVSLICLVLVAIGMYTYKWNIVWFPVPVFNLLKKLPTDFVACGSALLLIMLSMTERINMTFNNKYLVELGKISFSLYLIHPLIIGVIAIHLGNILPVYVVVILSVILSLLLAFPFHYWVEWPLQKLGRKLGDQLK